MKLYIAGGVGEHGRNCFMVTSENTTFLVDCGIMAGDSEPYPHLSDEQIRSAEYLFLTHSHADHCGALEWLYSKGFDGTVVSTAPTFEQMKISPLKALCLEKNFPNGIGDMNGMKIRWGRSGHCLGSVWYRFELNGSSILFTGDYIENTLVYRCDRIRDMYADKAVIDCAYGYDPANYAEYCRTLVEKTTFFLTKYPLLLFPVPKYGRGEELAALLAAGGINANYYGDEHFIKQMSDNAPFWKKSRSKMPHIDPISKADKGICFISSPQLSDHDSAETVKEFISNGGYAVMTGTVESGSLSEEIIKTGHGEFIRYPVHQGINEYKALCRNNQFDSATAYHTKEKIPEYYHSEFSHVYKLS